MKGLVGAIVGMSNAVRYSSLFHDYMKLRLSACTCTCSSPHPNSTPPLSKLWTVVVSLPPPPSPLPTPPRKCPLHDRSTRYTRVEYSTSSKDVDSYAESPVDHPRNPGQVFEKSARGRVRGSLSDGHQRGHPHVDADDHQLSA